MKRKKVIILDNVKKLRQLSFDKLLLADFVAFRRKDGLFKIIKNRWGVNNTILTRPEVNSFAKISIENRVVA